MTLRTGLTSRCVWPTRAMSKKEEKPVDRAFHPRSLLYLVLPRTSFFPLSGLPMSMSPTFQIGRVSFYRISPLLLSPAPASSSLPLARNSELTTKRVIDALIVSRSDHRSVAESYFDAASSASLSLSPVLKEAGPYRENVEIGVMSRLP